MSKRKKTAAVQERRECETAEVQRAITHLEQSPPQVDAALSVLRGAAIGLAAADDAEGEGDGEAEGAEE